jgi:hypothetical protein
MSVETQSRTAAPILAVFDRNELPADFAPQIVANRSSVVAAGEIQEGLLFMGEPRSPGWASKLAYHVDHMPHFRVPALEKFEASGRD